MTNLVAIINHNILASMLEDIIEGRFTSELEEELREQLTDTVRTSGIDVDYLFDRVRKYMYGERDNPYYDTSDDNSLFTIRTRKPTQVQEHLYYQIYLIYSRYFRIHPEHTCTVLLY